MATYKTPGVYVKEIATLSPSVAEVSTAIPAFIGFTEKVPESGAKIPVKITSLLEYENLFGKAKAYKYQVVLTTDADTKVLSIFSLGEDPEAEKDIMYYALQLYFINGGGPCYIVPLEKANKHEDGLTAIAKVDEVTLLVCPDVHSRGKDYASVYNAALSQCGELKDRFTILDVPKSISSASEFRNKVSSENLKYGAAYLPYLNSSINYEYDESQVNVTIGSSSEKNKGEKLDVKKAGNTEIYNFVKAALQNAPKVILPPSAAIAGIYARVDRDRGVWKAPANVSVLGVTGPTEMITNAEQDDLNVDATSGKSINAIRSFAGKGTLVWGARTLAGNDNEWRYVPVRRLFNMIEESIQKATSFAVFEPNNTSTWLKVKAMIDSYLFGLWQQGALAGATPEQAYFVHVGLGKTMTPQDILEGRMIVQVGIAAVRPAEFIILRFSHKLQEA